MEARVQSTLWFQSVITENALMCAPKVRAEVSQVYRVICFFSSEKIRYCLVM